MSKRVTIADVAELAGVHKATVSRALNALTEHQVNTVTLKRVQRAAKQLGYVPNAMARGLRTSLSMNVGVIVPDITNPIFPPILRGIEDYLAPHGYTALVANSDGRDSQELAAFSSLMARRVDGFILATGHPDHPVQGDDYQREVPIVLANRGSVDGRHPAVTGDDNAGITAALRHLVDLGHRHIVHLAGPRTFISEVRANSFLAAAAGYEGLRHSVVTASALSVLAGQASTDALIATGEAPTAIIAGNDLLALGVLRSLRAHGLSCPDDMSVVGFNDMPFAEDFYPPLTTVRVPYLEMGRAAARLLLESFASRGTLPVTLMLPVSLVVRASTGRAPVALSGAQPVEENAFH